MNEILAVRVRGEMSVGCAFCGGDIANADLFDLRVGRKGSEAANYFAHGSCIRERMDPPGKAMFDADFPSA